MPEFALRACRAALAAMILLASVPAGALTLFQGDGRGHSWPLWDRFADGFIQDDGRVVDWTDNARTVSEAQAYGLFFALVANDRTRFARILAWTGDNLAGGDLGQHLPAWLWGQHPENGNWQVLDPNPASDANLFIAYSLLEAARLWERPEYRRLAEQLLAMVRERETAVIDSRHVLLPGPEGFVSDGTARLNPSYVPPFQLHYLAQHDADGPWAAILAESVQALDVIAPNGLPPDWVQLGEGGYRPDPEHGTRGSYDAIRVFLWAAMEVPGLPILDRMRGSLIPAVRIITGNGVMPEKWDVASAALSGEGPPGFQLVAATWLDSMGYDDIADRFAARAENQRVRGLYGQPARYYDQVLALFANGLREGRFRFRADGSLIPAWETS
ncbi:cellulose synthase complex periplasmic endoglucanase BcsZ [Algiphilus sp.]|uniref:cellulose synthase complex periplasmic endoglucanase BcsZ n=1 Tax=Algiphilus sp. TaxID=1872431 RepID=UPI003C37529C